MKASEDSVKRPIAHSYWVVPGRFIAGEYPGSKDEAEARAKLQALKDAGVTAFIDLTEEGELLPYAHLLDGAAHRRFPIRDGAVPAARATTRAILDAIDAEIAHGGCVYLHCWGGVGRTGLIVGCWLARHGPAGQAALDRLQALWRTCPKSAWRRSPETPAQARYVRAWME